jgi:hypothetical protein
MGDITQRKRNHTQVSSRNSTRARSTANALLASLDRIESTELSAMQLEQRAKPTDTVERFPSLVSARRSDPKPRKKIGKEYKVPM